MILKKGQEKIVVVPIGRQFEVCEHTKKFTHDSPAMCRLLKHLYNIGWIVVEEDSVDNYV